MKNQHILFAILSLFIFTNKANAQYPVDGPYQSIAPPSMALPALEDTVIDYSVPSPIAITRITEYYQPWDWYPIHAYAKTQVWNADQTLYKIRTWKVFDANTYQDVQDLTGDIYPSYWSNTNPDLIWSFNENGIIKKHFVSTNQTQNVDTIKNQLGSAYEFVKLGPGEGNIDKNDHYVAFVGKDGLDMDVIIYDLQNLQVVHIRKFVGGWQNGGSSFPYYVDWVSVSQSGNYVVIMWNHNTSSQANPYIENGNPHYGVEVFNALDMQYQNRIIHYGNHGDLGYAVDGDEVLVQFYGVQSNGLYMHKLNGTGSTTIIQNPDFGVDGHVSCRNINRPGWAYVTHSDAAQSGQLIAVKLDNSGTVEHYGHHFSSNTSYDQSPMACASPNGDKLCFKSDFGTGPNTNPSIVYSFFAYLAEVSYDTINPLSCGNYTSPSGNYSWASSGTYYDTIPNSLGFDSLLTINLTITPLNVNINTSAYPTLSVELANATSYKWLDCQNNYSEINGETNQSFTPSSNGSYAVEITDNGCVDTSACINITDLGLENFNTTSIQLIPNPNNGKFSLVNLSENTTIQIFSVDGKKVAQTILTSQPNYTFNLEYLEKGIYFAKISTNQHQKTIQFCVE